jgi:ferredoxin
VKGSGEEGDIELLEELCQFLEVASLCALGTSAANPVLSAIKHFRDEFEAHIRLKQCPALSCPELLHYRIEPELCPGCQLCRKECPTEAVVGKPKGVHVINQEKCIKCGNCLQVCPEKFHAVIKVPGPAVREAA